MERAERVGLGVATAGHVLLFGILSLGLVSTARLPPPRSEPIDVQLVDAIGLRSASPEPAVEPPAPSEAPDEGPPADAAPPEPAPPEPAPKPTPPEPAPPPPKPAPPPPTPEKKPVPKAEPKVAPKPEPKPQPPKPEPKPQAPKPEPKPPKAQAKPAPPAPAKTPPTKVAPDKAAPAKTTAAAAKSTGLSSVAKTIAEARGNDEKGAKPKATGTRLGANFLKGVAPEKSEGKAATPPGAAVNAQAMSGLAAAIKRQVEPCYELGSLAGTPAMSIVTTLRLRFRADGSVDRAPTVSDHNGVNADNQAYVRQIDDVARRAVLRCSPLRLPAELYEGGWEDIELRFIPGQMG